MRVSEQYGPISSSSILKSFKSSLREFYWSHQLESENFKILHWFKRGIKRQSISGDYSCLSTETGSDISWSEILNNHYFEVTRKLCFNLQKWYGLNLYRSRSPSVQSIPVNEFSSTEHEFRLEESFTVLLGKYNTSLS